MENYIVSARKYRPSSFDAVVGQSALTTTLKNAVRQGKLAHAYLFCGPRGVGKTTCARIFAKTINCLTPTDSGEACGACESCRSFADGVSYNIYELDAASNNSVEDIRSLIERVGQPPQVGRYKVFIIDEVHMLSAAAFNAFLKTLEEPPSYAVFILATTEKHKILPTILSRCQIYDFNRMEVPDIIAHLRHVAEKEGIKYEEEALGVIARKADGGMRDALSLFDQAAGFSEGDITYKKVIEDLGVLDYEHYFAITENVLQGNVPAVMLSLADVLGKGFDGASFMAGFAAHLRDLLVSRDAQTLPLLEVSAGVRERYREQAAKCKVPFLYRALRLCNECDINYRSSSNKRLLIEITLIQIVQSVSDDEDASAGRRPVKILKPLFRNTQRPPQAAVGALTPAATAAPAAGGKGTTPIAAGAGNRMPDAAAAGGKNRPDSAQGEQSPAHRNAAAPESQPAAWQSRPASARALSIRGLMSNAGVAAVSAAPAAGVAQSASSATAAAAHGTLETPFEEKDLSYYWYRFAHSLPKEESAMAGRMQNMRPTLGDGWTVTVPVENEIVEEYMRRLQVKIVSYLREQLRNDHISLQYRLVEQGEPGRAYSRKEQYSDMLTRSVALSMLAKELKLELA